MTELIVTPSLISDLSSINKELKIKSNIEKLTYEEFKNENSISLFENDTYKFIYDQYVSYSELKKFNYNFNEKYIFQIKKQNLSKFSSENKEDISGVNIKSDFCFTALEISFSVFFKLCKILLFDFN